MTERWTLADLVDLDHFVCLDRQDDSELHERDRHIFLTAAQDKTSPAQTHRHCLRLWLRRRREERAKRGQEAPGRLLSDHLRRFRLLVILSGLVAGFVLGGSYFAYSGATPLNVFTFFTLFILPQLLLLLLLLARSGIAARMLPPALEPAGLTRAAFARYLRLRRRFSSGGQPPAKAPDLPPELLRSTTLPLRWPLFVQGQLFGLAGNCGLLLVSLYKVVTSDLAFGWQTTLQFGPEALSNLVQILATPWTWLVGDTFAAPSLAQIQGSRIILKDGIQHLLTNDLTSWWPFLLMSLIFYGLLPRAALLCFGLFRQRRAFRRFLGQRRFRLISRRMQLPLLSTGGEVQPPAAQVDGAAGPAAAVVTGSEAASGSTTVLVPVDIAGAATTDAVAALLARHGYGPGETRIIFRDYDEDMQTLASLEDAEEPVLVLLEAWMAPIGEQLDFLARLSSALAESATLAICLLGRPAGDNRLTAPGERDNTLWRRRIERCCEGVAYLTIDSKAQDRKP